MSSASYCECHRHVCLCAHVHGCGVTLKGMRLRGEMQKCNPL